MSLIDELHKLMKEKKYTFAYTAKAMNISSTALHLWLKLLRYLVIAKQHHLLYLKNFEDF